jgi:hypothetical protein
MQEIADVMNGPRMVNHKSPGDDGIDYELIKNGGNALALALFEVYGIIWSTEEVPDSFRLALICPVYKRKGLDRSELKNYRPISLTSTVGKCLEAVILHRVTSFIENNNLLSDYQGGFRWKRGCPDLIFLVSELVQSRCERPGWCYAKSPRGKTHTRHCYDKHNIDGPCNPKPTFIAFLDVASAYDTVWHDRLWDRLRAVGIVGKTLAILQAWYRDNKSCVLLGGSDRTDWFSVTQGVRQGSLLSPMLYALFIDPITSALQPHGVSFKDVDGNDVYCGVAAYADDLVLIANSAEELQLMLKIAEDFSVENRFRFKPSKCEVMTVNTDPQVIPLQIYGEKITECSFFRYLGAEIQDNGGWDRVSHRMYRNGLARYHQWKQLGLSTQGFSSHTSARLYRSLIEPCTTYACDVWSPNSASARSLSRFQLMTGRTCLGVRRRTPSTPVLGDLWLAPNRRAQGRTTSSFSPSPVSYASIAHSPPSL